MLKRSKSLSQTLFVHEEKSAGHPLSLCYHVLLEKLPVHHGDTLVLEHRVLRSYEIEQAFLALSLSVLLKLVKSSTPYLVRIIEELPLWFPSLNFRHSLLLLFMKQPPVVDRQALEQSF